MQIEKSLELLSSRETLGDEDGRLVTHTKKLWIFGTQNPKQSRRANLRRTFVILSLASTRRFNESLKRQDRIDFELSRELRKTSKVINLNQGLAEEFIEKAISSSLIRVTDDRSVHAGKVAELAIALFEPLMNEDASSRYCRSRRLSST